MILTVAVGFLGGLYFWGQNESAQVGEVITKLSHDGSKKLQELIEVRGSSLKVLADDYSWWDEMVTFVSNGDSVWAKDNIETGLRTFDASAAWVCRTDLSLVHTAHNLEGHPVLELPFSSADKTTLFRNGFFPNFFAKTDMGLLEIYGAPIQSLGGDERTSPEHGFLFVARLWTDETLKEFGRVLDADLSLSTLPYQSATATADDSPKTIRLVDTLPAWDGTPVAIIHGDGEAHALNETTRILSLGKKRAHAFAATLLILLFLALYLWISRPLARISKALTTGNVDHLIELEEQRTEFGRLSRLISRFFRQKKSLENEVAERKAAERELKKLMLSAEQSASMICITDRDGAIEYVNPKWCQVNDISVEEALGRVPHVLDPSVHEECFHHDVWQTITAGQTWSEQVRHKQANDETIWERCVISPVKNDENEVDNFIIISEDITKEHLVQRKLAESDKMAAVGTLAAGVAHEFKNYLAGIMGNASLALEDIDGPSGVESARIALEQVVELSEQANEVAMSLLTYSQPSSKSANMESLAQILRKTLTLVGKELQDRQIQVVTNIDEIPLVQASASAIQQLLINLLENAIHAVTGNGVIVVVLTHENGFAKLRIGDTGAGIPEKILTRIFDPFFSTKGVWGKEDVAGTGMGLAICRNIAREHKGDLTVESIRGQGSTFTLTLPLVDAARRESSIELSDGLSLKILVFSGNDSVRNHFLGQAGFAAAVDCIDSVARVTTNTLKKTDLVLCDAKFVGKIELLKLADLCQAASLPYVVVNIREREYQLEPVFDAATTCFSGLPSLDEIMGQLQAGGNPAKTA